MYIELLLFAVGLIGLAIFFLSVKIIFHKDKKFPETEVGHNEEMRKRGIVCAKCEELKSCSVKG